MKKLKRIKFTPLIIKLNNNKLLFLIIIFYMITSTELKSASSKLLLNEDIINNNKNNNSKNNHEDIVLDNNLPSDVVISTQKSTNLITDNETGEGMLLGDACHNTCSPNLQNVICDEETNTCECAKKYPVRLSPTIGCAKPVRLGEQCLYDRTCSFNELHSICIQIHHNAICQCKPGYHIVALHKPRERVFCSEDILIIKTDVNTLFGMAAGIAVITGLICFVLKLYSRARYAPPRHYANANLPPPILFASETGIPLAVHRPPSRNSGTRSAPPFSRRPSSSMGLIGPGTSSSRAGAATRAAAILLISCHFDPHNARNIIATTSIENEKLQQDEDEEIDDDDDDNNHNNNNNKNDRDDDDELFHIDDDDDDISVDVIEDDFETSKLQDTARNKYRGSRRPSTASFNSSSSSIRSYGIRRLEQEQEQKYQRSLMRMQSAQAIQSQGSTGTLQSSSGNLISSSLGSVSFGHSCKTPLSTDDLLPSVCELNEPISQPGSSGSQHKTRTTSLQPIIDPSSSSDSDDPVDERTRRFLQGKPPSPIP